jgi:hypothetical protein
MTVGRVAIAGVLLAAVAALAVGPDDPPRATMGEIFARIRVLLPLSLQAETFAGANRERVERALTELAAQAEVLESHSRSRDAGFAALAQTLADDADTIARRYRRGEPEAARFLFRRAVGNCVACHTRVRSANEFALGRRLLADIDVATLPLRERARLEVVVRQFPEALSSYERLFAATDAVPMRMAFEGDFAGYLKLCLGVEDDEARAIRTLRRLLERGDLLPELVRSVEAWIESIEALQRDPIEKDPIARARTLVSRAEALSPPTGPTGPTPALAYYVEAWNELQRFVDAHPEPSIEVAEAYYHLGRVESRLWSGAWLSGAEPFLEASIRIAPSRPFAREAYVLLEDLVLLGYTGSSGTQVPPEVQRELDELRRSLELPADTSR